MSPYQDFGNNYGNRYGYQQPMNRTSYNRLNITNQRLLQQTFNLRQQLNQANKFITNFNPTNISGGVLNRGMGMNQYDYGFRSLETTTDFEYRKLKQNNKTLLTIFGGTAAVLIIMSLLNRTKINANNNLTASTQGGGTAPAAATAGGDSGNSSSVDDPNQIVVSDKKLQRKVDRLMAQIQDVQKKLENPSLDDAQRDEFGIQLEKLTSDLEQILKNHLTNEIKKQIQDIREDTDKLTKKENQTPQSDTSPSDSSPPNRREWST